AEGEREGARGAAPRRSGGAERSAKNRTEPDVVAGPGVPLAFAIGAAAPVRPRAEARAAHALVLADEPESLEPLGRVGATAAVGDMVVEGVGAPLPDVAAHVEHTKGGRASHRAA